MNQNGFLKPKIKTGFDLINTFSFGSVNLLNTALLSTLRFCMFHDYTTSANGVS